MKRKVFVFFLAVALLFSMALSVSAYGDERYGVEDFDVGQAVLIAVIAGVVIGLIVALILRAQLKTVHPQNQADAYIRPGSMHVRSRSDRFLHRNVSRIKRSTGK